MSCHDRLSNPSPSLYSSFSLILLAAFMAPLPADAASQALGGNEAALQFNTLLAFAAILFASMQGTLCMESADPCRISYMKLQFLLGLEILEVIVVVASEALSFKDLSGALGERLTWLRWVPTCLLVLGLMELILDMYFTFECAARSRVDWEPFSSVGYSKDKSRFRIRVLLELMPLLLTGTVSLVLVGWRQKWWMKAEAVSTEIALAAAKKSKALSVGAIMFCFVWGFILTGGLLIFVTFRAVDSKLYKLWYCMPNPKQFWMSHPHLQRSEFIKPDKERIDDFEKLYQIQFGSRALKDLTDADIMRYLETTPLSVGNAVVGKDKSLVFDGRTRLEHIVLLVAEHFTILPLQICVAIGLVQVYSKLDVETFAALKELVGAMVVVAMVEIAVGLKSFLWGFGGVGELHENDERIGDPYRVR